MFILKYMENNAMKNIFILVAILIFWFSGKAELE